MPPLIADGTRIPSPVRDLEWVISSPLLLKQAPCPNLFADSETTEFIEKLRANPAQLLDYLANKETRVLGVYFEHLILFWLSNLPSVSLISSNLQVFQGTRTIGEIDVIFEHEKRVFHWEIAVKFYLNIGNGRQASHFVGPRLKDALNVKLKRIFDHQIPLIEVPETRELLAALNVKEVVSSAMMKGVLFQPLPGPPTQITSLPSEISNTCQSGSWVTLKNINRVASQGFTHFLILSKAQWFTSFYYSDEVVSGDVASLEKQAAELLKSGNTPIMVCLFRSSDAGIFKSNTRLFITPDEWPTLAGKPHNC